MTSRNQKLVHPAPGRIDMYKNTADKVSRDLTHVLPDGSRLTDRANERLLQTIVGVIEASEPRLEGSSHASVIGALYILIQWMFLRSIYRFRSLNKGHYNDFLLDSAKGLDVCIKATERMHAHLKTLKGMPKSERAGLSVVQLFEDARIPPTYTPRLSRTVALVRKFIKKGDSALTDSAAKPPVVKLSSARLRTIVSAVERLWKYRASLADPATVAPYPENIARVIKRLGSEKKQTEVIPHALAMKFLTGVIDAVMNIGPALLDWEDARKSANGSSDRVAASFNNLRRVVRESWNHDVVMTARGAKHPYVTASSIAKALLPTACKASVLGVGRRKTEVESLESNCISGSASEGHKLSTYIAKRQAYESRPCPDIVARAIELMNRYQGYATDEVRPLFVQRGKSLKMRLTTYVDRLADLFGARQYVDRNGQTRVWHWKDHQQRRLYVIWYIWRYEDSSYLALRHHLGQGSEGEAAYYARLSSDQNFSDLVDEAGVFTLEMLREATSGDRLVGTHAEVIAKRVERLRVTLKLTGEKSLETAFELLIEEGLTIHASPWGYCGCRATPSNMRRAKCRQGARSQRPKHPAFNTPIPEDSEEETCASCYFHSTKASREPHWRNVVLHLDRAIDGAMPGSLVAKLLKERREKVHAAAERYFGEAINEEEITE